MQAEGKYPLSFSPHLRYNPIMAKSIRVKPKKRGRPATGKDPLYGVRMPDTLMLAVDRWGTENDAPSRSAALRSLVELGLSFSTKVPKVKN